MAKDKDKKTTPIVHKPDDNTEIYPEENVDNVNDIKGELLEIERSKPLEYLRLSNQVNGTLGGRARIKGTITNTATLAYYKDAQIKMTFYTETNTEISVQYKYFYKIFNPRSSKSFDWKIDTPKNTRKVGLSIANATAVH